MTLGSVWKAALQQIFQLGVSDGCVRTLQYFCFSGIWVNRCIIVINIADLSRSGLGNLEEFIAPAAKCLQRLYRMTCVDGSRRV